MMTVMVSDGDGDDTDVDDSKLMMNNHKAEERKQRAPQEFYS